MSWLSEGLFVLQDELCFVEFYKIICFCIVLELPDFLSVMARPRLQTSRCPSSSICSVSPPDSGADEMHTRVQACLSLPAAFTPPLIPRCS